jgi:hypothetical protein
MLARWSFRMEAIGLRQQTSFVQCAASRSSTRRAAWAKPPPP